MGAIGRNVLPRWIDFSTQGTSGHSVADVAYEASITHGPAIGDFLGLPAKSIALNPVMPRRVLACRTFRTDVDPDIEANYESMIDALIASGVTVERVASPSDNDTIWNWFIMSTAQLTQSLRHEEHRWNELSDYVQSQLKFGATVTIDQYIAAQRKRHEISIRFDELLGNDAVLLTPTSNARSWPAEGPLPTRAGNTDDPMITLNTPDANLTGHPATSVPMGLDENGVPCGIHITGPRFADNLTLGLASHIERIKPWPLTAPGYTPFFAD
jgi:aspartyl-tRNA(Asn)/glutamyl-tRNA(Gln) amidotransferase subunit A